MWGLAVGEIPANFLRQPSTSLEAYLPDAFLPQAQILTAQIFILSAA